MQTKPAPLPQILLFAGSLALVGACNGDDGGDGSATEGSTTGTTSGGESTTQGTTSDSSGSESDSEGSSSGGELGSCDPDAPIDLEVSGAIKEDVTWQGTVRVSGSVDVSAEARLTIMPGTAVIFDVGTDLELGWNGQAASLMAVGTAEAPIELCGRSPEAGSWRGVSIRKNVTSDSVIEHVRIRHAGSGEAPALVLEAPITALDVKVEAVGGAGVEAVDFASGSARLSVSGAKGAPLVTTGSGAIMRLPLGGSLTGNGEDVVEVRFTRIEANTTFEPPGIPYRQYGSMDVLGEAEVVFKPGVEYLVSVDADLEFGWNGQAATVFAEGTAEAPVIFAGAVAEPGSWRGLMVRQNVTTNSRFGHVIVRDAGGGSSYAMELRSKITLDQVRLEGNSAGIFVAAQGLSASTKDVTVTETEGVPLVLESEAIHQAPTGGSYVGNMRDEIEVKGGGVKTSGTMAAVGVPYLISGSLDVFNEAELTIAAGVELVMGPDVDVEIGWNGQTAALIAQGTAEEPIVLRGRDPVPGWWRGLIIRQNTLSSSKLEHLRIGHAGHNNGGNLVLYRPLPVVSSHFHDSAGFGIKRAKDDVSDYLSGNTFENNASGDVGQI
ncbi:MAG: hypothetical protein IPK80_20390 [Nannocystis sp.]|nr:hypothetical protein [Nannocystis sp.]